MYDGDITIDKAPIRQVRGPQDVNYGGRENNQLGILFVHIKGKSDQKKKNIT